MTKLELVLEIDHFPVVETGREKLFLSNPLIDPPLVRSVKSCVLLESHWVVAFVIRPIANLLVPRLKDTLPLAAI